jgi:hypothetical protein
MLSAIKGEAFDSTYASKQKIISLAKELKTGYESEVEAALKEIPGDTKIVLAIDECSFLIEEMLKTKGENIVENTRGFLKWLRHIRSLRSNVIFVFSGSIKISVFERMVHGDAFFNDCSEYRLEPFDQDAASNLVNGLFFSEGIYPPDYVVDTIIEITIPNFPYFLHIVTAETINHYLSHREFPNKQDIQDIIDTDVIGTGCRRFLDQLLVNLRRYQPDEQIGAKAILNYLSQMEKVKFNKLETIYKNATGKIDNFEKVLDLLEYDFYIKREDGLFFFNNDIVKKWWKTNFVSVGDWL